MFVGCRVLARGSVGIPLCLKPPVAVVPNEALVRDTCLRSTGTVCTLVRPDWLTGVLICCTAAPGVTRSPRWLATASWLCRSNSACWSGDNSMLVADRREVPPLDSSPRTEGEAPMSLRRPCTSAVGVWSRRLSFISDMVACGSNSELQRLLRSQALPGCDTTNCAVPGKDSTQ